MTSVAWQPAEVLESGEEWTRLRFSRPDLCQRCRQGNGCGAGVFGALFPRRAVVVEVRCGFKVGAGEWVRVGIPSRSLLLAALTVYGLPLAAFIVGALPAHWWIEAPLFRDLMALAGGLFLALVTWRAAWKMCSRIQRPLVEPLSCGGGATRSSTVQ